MIESNGKRTNGKNPPRSGSACEAERETKGGDGLRPLDANADEQR